MLPTRDLDHVIEHTGEVWRVLAGQSSFITGGTGLVGTWLCESLIHANCGVQATVLTRNPESFAFADRGIKAIEGDVRTFEFPEGDFPFVIHGATPASLDDFDR